MLFSLLCRLLPPLHLKLGSPKLRSCCPMRRNVPPCLRRQGHELSPWHCPICRSEYRGPPSDDPWILLHSCGEVCDRPLKRNCGLQFLLLYHPGPCTSCPKLVKACCFCGKFEDVKRCGFKNFSYEDKCGKSLGCGTHKCGGICHEGRCPPCRVHGVFRCQYGKEEEERECCDRAGF